MEAITMKNEDCISLIRRNAAIVHELKNIDSGALAEMTEFDLAELSLQMMDYQEHSDLIVSDPKIYRPHAFEMEVILSELGEPKKNEDVNDLIFLLVSDQIHIAKSDSAKVGAGLSINDMNGIQSRISKIKLLIDKSLNGTKKNRNESNS